MGENNMMSNNFLVWLQAQPKDKQFLIVIGFIGTFAILIFLSYLWDKHKENK